MNNLIITTGYMASGSSAMTNLLSEIDGFKAVNNSFEYVFLHCPNGLFDFEDKLLLGNNANRSDEAIHSFYNCMNMLYKVKEKDYWIAGYRNNVSQNFMLYVKDFLKDLNLIKTNSYWYYQQNPNLKIKFKKFIGKCVRKASFGHIIFKEPLKYYDMFVAYPTEKEFYNAAKKFVSKVIQSIDLGNSNLIMDQLLLPHNLYRIDKYFDDQTKVFVVERDPRDVFIINKYYYKNNSRVPYPDNVWHFCKMYKAIRQNERIIKSKKIIRIFFEDLIYNYEQSLSNIYKVLEIPSSMHSAKGEKFSPKVSINNTQLFNKKEKYKNEVLIIQDELKEYLYNFPYELKNTKTNVF